MPEPLILTTTVGSYPVPDWLAALPSEQARLDATRVVFDIQRQAGIDLPTDGELYRFDVNHPDTNGMIEYFVRAPGRDPHRGGAQRIATAFRAHGARCGFGASPPVWWRGPIGEGSLNLLADCARAASRRRRAVQVHGHQSVHARAHAARPALRRLRARC